MATERSIKILYPISLDLIGPLGTLIGEMWPGSMMKTTSSEYLEITFPSTAPHPLSEETKESLLDGQDEDSTDLILEGMKDGVISLSANKHAWEHLGMFALVALRFEDTQVGPEEFPLGVNYVEMKAKFDGEHVAIIAARASRTPHDLRLAAEKRADRAEATLARYVEKFGELSM